MAGIGRIACAVSAVSGRRDLVPEEETIMTKKKKRTRLIAAVLLLAVLAVIYILVLRADFNGEDAEEEIEKITVLEIAREDISTVRLENSYGTLQFAYDGETWTSEDDPVFQLNQDSMSALQPAESADRSPRFGRAGGSGSLRPCGTGYHNLDYASGWPGNYRLPGK